MNSFGDLSIKYNQCKSTDMTWRSISKVMHSLFPDISFSSRSGYSQIIGSPYTVPFTVPSRPPVCLMAMVAGRRLGSQVSALGDHKDQPKFQLQDISSICEGINNGFESVHKDTEPLRGNVRICFHVCGD